MIYRRNPAVVHEEIDDRLMMMNPERAEFVTLSPTGRGVWDALEAPGSPADIVERLQPNWPAADPAQMLNDVTAFLEKLEKTGAVLGE
jgi:Coenzyme PQQ synthesis protein D (PqqD)